MQVVATSKGRVEDIKNLPCVDVSPTERPSHFEDFIDEEFREVFFRKCKELEDIVFVEISRCQMMGPRPTSPSHAPPMISAFSGKKTEQSPRNQSPRNQSPRNQSPRNQAPRIRGKLAIEDPDFPPPKLSNGTCDDDDDDEKENDSKRTSKRSGPRRSNQQLPCNLSNMLSYLRKEGPEEFLQTCSKSYVEETSDAEKRRFEKVLKEVVREDMARLSNANSLRMMWNDMRTRSFVVESFADMVIVLNAVVIGLSCDLERNWKGWIAIDSAFAATFAAALITNMYLQGVIPYLFLEDRAWHWFEIVSVILAIFEVAITMHFGKTDSQLALLRIMRLVRVTRLIRLLRLDMFSDLMIMIKGATRGFRTLGWAVVLICLPLYGFAIAFRETLGQHVDDGAFYFNSISRSFFTLFRCSVAGECTDEKGRPLQVLVTDAYGWGYGLVFCMIEMFMSFGLFNIVMASIVENVLAGARTNDQIMKRERFRDRAFFVGKMTQLIGHFLEVVHENSLHKDEVFELPCEAEEIFLLATTLEITPEVFEEVLCRSGVHDIFQDLAIAEEDVLNLFETLDVNNSGAIDIQELVDGIAKLRGDAKRSDIVQLTIMVQQLQEQMKESKQLLNKIGSTTQPRSKKFAQSVRSRSFVQLQDEAKAIAKIKLYQSEPGNADPRDSDVIVAKVL